MLVYLLQLKVQYTYILIFYFHTYKHLVTIIRKTTVFILLFIPQCIEFNGIFSGVQKDLDSKHLLRHSKSSSCSPPYLMTSLSMQPLAKSINCDQSVILRHTWVFSLVMRIYRPQYTDRVCCESSSSCTLFLGIWPLNVTRMNHCISFNTAWPEEVPIFRCGLRSSLLR